MSHNVSTARKRTCSHFPLRCLNGVYAEGTSGPFAGCIIPPHDKNILKVGKWLIYYRQMRWHCLGGNEWNATVTVGENGEKEIISNSKHQKKHFIKMSSSKSSRFLLESLLFENTKEKWHDHWLTEQMVFALSKSKVLFQLHRLEQSRYCLN